MLEQSTPPNPYRAGPPPVTAFSEQIILHPPARPASTPPAQKPAKEEERKDGFREIVETIVFVVVLVLLLKTFIAEAFVIPTGSMADTLYGYHKQPPTGCIACGRPMRINCSQEVEPQDGMRPAPVTDGICENCGKINSLAPRLPEDHP